MARTAAVAKKTRSRNPRVAARTIKPTRPQSVPFEEDAVDEQDEKERIRLEAKAGRKRALMIIPEILAGSKFHYKNWLWDQDKSHFPHWPRLRHVDLYYPEAEGGPLLVDFPMKEDYAQELRKQKQPIILKAGFRYICLSQNTTVDEAQEALGRLDLKRKAKK